MAMQQLHTPLTSTPQPAGGHLQQCLWDGHAAATYTTYFHTTTSWWTPSAVSVGWPCSSYIHHLLPHHNQLVDTFSSVCGMAMQQLHTPLTSTPQPAGGHLQRCLWDGHAATTYTTYFHTTTSWWTPSAVSVGWPCSSYM